MGLLSQIIDQPSSPPAIDAAAILESLFGDSESPTEKLERSTDHVDQPAHTCQACGSAILWLSVYRDGVHRCAVCEPPPTDRMVATYLIDGETMSERRRRLDTSTDQNANDPRWQFGGIDPWEPYVLERFEEYDVFGWPTLVLKREFRKPFARRA